MALKDKRWELTGDKQFADITLKNPTLRVRTVLYNAETRTAEVEVLARENGGNYEHARTFSYELQGDDESLSAQNVQLIIDTIFGVNQKK